MSLTLQISPKGRKIRGLPSSIEISPSNPVESLHERLAAATKLSKYRLRITRADDGKVVNISNKESIVEAGLSNGTALLVKDLGPQIGWRTVFIIEYLGPLIIHPLFYAARAHLYPYLTGPIAAASPTQTLMMWLITLHFLKRELEGIFLHRFSSATMPFTNVFKNSAHYWLLSGVLLAWDIYRPGSAVANPEHWTNAPLVQYGLTAVFAVAELGNFLNHYTLANLRPKGTTTRGIPRGLGFGVVTCPNYGFEALVWAVIIVMSGFSVASIIFWIVASAQMWLWAKKKENRYRKEFEGKYKKKRFMMWPGLF